MVTWVKVIGQRSGSPGQKRDLRPHLTGLQVMLEVRGHNLTILVMGYGVMWSHLYQCIRYSVYENPFNKQMGSLQRQVAFLYISTCLLF